MALKEKIPGYLACTSEQSVAFFTLKIHPVSEAKFFSSWAYLLTKIYLLQGVISFSAQ